MFFATIFEIFIAKSDEIMIVKIIRVKNNRRVFRFRSGRSSFMATAAPERVLFIA